MCEFLWSIFVQAIMKERTKERPWSMRRPVALWRGGTSGKSCWDGRVGAPIEVQDTSSSANMRGNCYRHLEDSTAASPISSDAAGSFNAIPEVCAVEKLSDEDEAAEDEERAHARNREGAEKTKSRNAASPPPPPPCGRRALRLEAATRTTRHLFDVAYSYLGVNDQLNCQALVYAEGHCG